MPPGLTINEYTGLISGTPTRVGSYAVTVTESEQGFDGGTISGSATFTWTVSSGPAVVYSGTIRLTQIGLYLDDRHNSSANGAIVQVWQRTGGPNQVWQVMSDGTIRHNGLCLTAEATKVYLVACNGGSNQLWSTQKRRLTKWIATNPAQNRVLNDTGYGGNGTQQELWFNTGTRNEIWATS